MKRKLFQDFEMKDIENLNYFFGIEMLISKEEIFINQIYVLYLLASIRLIYCKSAKTPIVSNHRLRIIEGATPTDKEKYQRILGNSFIFLILGQILHILWEW